MPSSSLVVRTSLPGPWGPIHVAATAHGVVAADSLVDEERFVARLVGRLGATICLRGEGVPAAERHLAAAIDALDSFLAGRPPERLPRFDLADRPTWDRRVLAAVAGIPWGTTASYGDIARRIRAPRAARAVGGAVGRNPLGLLVPCHRVIAADGTLGGYGVDGWGSRASRLAVKRALLLREGVTIAPGAD